MQGDTRSGAGAQDDLEQLDRLTGQLRRTVEATVGIAAFTTVGLWFLAAVPRGDGDVWTWHPADIPALPPATALSAFAVAIVVLAAVALTRADPSGRSREPDVVELGKDQVARGVAAASGIASGTLAVWGAIGSVTAAPDTGLGERVALALSCLSLGAILVALGGLIHQQEPARLRQVADARHAAGQARFVRGLGRWRGALPTLEAWSRQADRRRWVRDVLKPLGWQVATLTVAVTSLGNVTTAGELWPGAAHPAELARATLVGVALMVMVAVSLAFAGASVLWLPGWPAVIRWAGAAFFSVFTLGILLVAVAAAVRSWPVAITPSVALLLRVLVPLALGRKVAAVSTSRWGALVDHRFWVLIYFQQSIALPRRAADAPSPEHAPADALEEPQPPSTRVDRAADRWSVTVSIGRPRRDR